jgi:TrmH family RNA methyltransferase
MSFSVRIVLVEPSHPGNIGASARAMKTMGFDELVLVAPQDFPSAEATARASGADALLENARIVESLSDAIADCAFVVGASARSRSLTWPTTDPRACAEMVNAHSLRGNVSLVFGPEQSGLTNDDMSRCHQLVQIPANPEYSSLNLAMAVQVLCYELRMAQLEANAKSEDDPEQQGAPLATAGELNGFHEHLESVLTAAGFLHEDHPKLLKLRLRRIFHRSRLDQTEINILRGILKALDPRGTGRQTDKE